MKSEASKIYTPNNIRFRIVSSAAIAQFKQDQAFDFNELINNESYSFSPEAREILLLNYEVWFRFICRLEKIMIRTHHSNDLLGDLTVSIDIMAKDILIESHDVMQTHPIIFNSESPSVMLITKAHHPFLLHVLSEIAQTRDQNMYLAFPRIVNALSNMLHNLLFILHEVENLKKNNGNDFLSMTEEVIDIWKRTSVCPLVARAILYRESFNVPEFTVKNYSGAPIRKSCIALLTDQGIKVKSIDEFKNTDHAVNTYPNT